MLAKSCGFSRQLTHWVALLAFFAAVLSTGLEARAMLEDSEKKALADALKSYQQSRTMSEFLRRNRGYLDPESYVFLFKQSQIMGKRSLPKLTVHGDARISFKIDGAVYKMEFVSVRTQLMTINGRELEFLPNESAEARHDKVVSSLLKNQAAAHPLLQLLETRALAAGGNVDPKRLPIIKANLNSLATIVQTILSVARERNTPCAERNKKIKDLMAIYSNKPVGYEAAKQQAMAEAPGVPVARGDLATEEDFSKQKYECQAYDAIDLGPADIENLKSAGAAAKIDPLFYADDAAMDPAELTPVQLNALSQKNVLNLTYKWKLQQIRVSLVEMQKAEASNKACYAEAVAQVQEFLARIKKSTKTGRLRCYMDQVAKDIKEGSSTAPIPIVPPHRANDPAAATR